MKRPCTDPNFLEITGPCAIIVTIFSILPPRAPLTASSSDKRDTILAALSSQSRPTVTVLSSLLAVQDELGYLPDEAIEEVATFMGATINDVWGVATFYTNFRFTPPADHIVEVCWGPTCHLVGATSILMRLQADLGLTGEGDTPDRKVTLRYNTCLGACAQAPVVSVDHRLVGRLTEESASSLVGSVAGPGR